MEEYKQKETDLAKEKSEAISHKESALKQLDNLLSYYIENNDYKKCHLLSYWFQDFAKYNISEPTFNPKKLKRYKRGDIIKAHLGFNIGNEVGGLHYCIVLDKNNYLSSGVLTVIPLTSIKENKQYNSKFCVNLGNEIYFNLKKLYDDMTKKISSKYVDIWNLPQEQFNEFTIDFEYAKKIQTEIETMKKGSIALIQQITTISKQRIFDPKTQYDILSKLKVSNSTLDLIDSKIKELFIK